MGDMEVHQAVPHFTPTAQIYSMVYRLYGCIPVSPTGRNTPSNSDYRRHTPTAFL